MARISYKQEGEYSFFYVWQTNSRPTVYVYIWNESSQLKSTQFGTDWLPYFYTHNSKLEGYFFQKYYIAHSHSLHAENFQIYWNFCQYDRFQEGTDGFTQ